MTEYPWRETYRLEDPRRVCYTCGAPPSSTFDDGSPLYRCGPHPPIRAPHLDGPIATAEPVVVTLTERQVAQVEPAVRRVTARYEEGKVARTRYIPPGYTIESAVRAGFLGEVAVAVWSDQRWNEGNAKLPDVGRRTEVRWTSVRPPVLTIYPHDRDGRPMVLVIGGPMIYELLGWIMIEDGRRIGVRRQSFQGLVVSLGSLHPMTEYRP